MRRFIEYEADDRTPQLRATEEVTHSLMNSLARELLSIHEAMSAHLSMIIMKSVCFDRVENYMAPVLDKAGVFNIYLGKLAV
jgi:hypothetical protein